MHKLKLGRPDSSSVLIRNSVQKLRLEGKADRRAEKQTGEQSNEQDDDSHLRAGQQNRDTAGWHGRVNRRSDEDGVRNHGI